MPSASFLYSVMTCAGVFSRAAFAQGGDSALVNSSSPAVPPAEADAIRSELDSIVEKVKALEGQIADNLADAPRCPDTTCTAPESCSMTGCDADYSASTTCGEEGSGDGESQCHGLSFSTLHLPPGTDDQGDAAALNFACSTKGLDGILSDAHQAGTQDYVTNSKGLTRAFPGYAQQRSHDDDGKQTCGSHLITEKPWFVSAFSGPKNMLIILDRSGSMARTTYAFEMSDGFHTEIEETAEQDCQSFVMHDECDMTPDGQEVNCTQKSNGALQNGSLYINNGLCEDGANGSVDDTCWFGHDFPDCPVRVENVTKEDLDLAPGVTRFQLAQDAIHSILEGLTEADNILILPSPGHDEYANENPGAFQLLGDSLVPSTAANIERMRNGVDRLTPSTGHLANWTHTFEHAFELLETADPRCQNIILIVADDPLTEADIPAAALAELNNATHKPPLIFDFVIGAQTTDGSIGGTCSHGGIHYPVQFDRKIIPYSERGTYDPLGNVMSSYSTVLFDISPLDPGIVWGLPYEDPDKGWLITATRKVTPMTDFTYSGERYTVPVRSHGLIVLAREIPLSVLSPTTDWTVNSSVEWLREELVRRQREAPCERLDGMSNVTDCLLQYHRSKSSTECDPATYGIPSMNDGFCEQVLARIHPNPATTCPTQIEGGLNAGLCHPIRHGAAHHIGDPVDQMTLPLECCEPVVTTATPPVETDAPTPAPTNATVIVVVRPIAEDHDDFDWRWLLLLLILPCLLLLSLAIFLARRHKPDPKARMKHKNFHESKRSAAGMMKLDDQLMLLEEENQMQDEQGEEEHGEASDEDEEEDAEKEEGEEHTLPHEETTTQAPELLAADNRVAVL